MALTLASFGAPRLLDESGAAIAFPEKGLLALAYIAARPTRRVSRVELANFLWSETTSNPLVNLRQLLSRIKARQTETGLAILDILEADVALPANGPACDFLLLQDAASDNPLRVVEMSLAFLTGNFFAGIEVSSDRAELWIAAIQEELLSRFSGALEALTHRDGTASRDHLLKQAAYRLLEFDPYDEVAYRTLIKVFASEGHLAQARAMFDRYSERLQKDLNATPDASMLALAGLAPGKTKPVAAIAAPQPRTVSRSFLPRLMLLPPTDAAPADSMLVTSLLEDVTISLCRARSIQLVGSHTARRIAIQDEVARQAAYQAGNISYVLETRFAPAAEATALFATLVNVADDAIVWADRLAIDSSNLGLAYTTVIRRIAAETVSHIERHEFSRMGRSNNPTAYQNFLLGQHHLRRMELPGIRRARKAFRATLKDAPHFSAAIAGLSRTEHLEWLLTARGDHELLALAERHAQDAIDADGNDAAGYHQLGVTRLYRGEFDESIEFLELAERNAPSHADLIADHADTLIHSSLVEKALEKINLAFELNPLGPDYYWWVAAGANYSLGRYETAIDNLTHVSDQTNVARFNAICWAMLGDTRKARAYMRQTMENLPDFEIDKWLSLIHIRDPGHREHYREGLRRAGFK